MDWSDEVGSLLQVKLGELWLPSRSLRALLEVRIQQNLSLPTQCELSFRAVPEDSEVVDRLVPGMDMVVALEEQRGELFRGEITAVEYAYSPENGEELFVRGYDALHRLRKRQHVRALTDITLEGLARLLIQDTSLTSVRSVESSEQALSWPLLIQHHQTDLEFLVETAAMAGFYLTVEKDVLHLTSLQGRADLQRTVHKLDTGTNLLAVQLEMNADTAGSSVETQGWDTRKARQQTHQVRLPRSGREVKASISPKSVGASPTHWLLNEHTPDDAHAKALAQAALDQQHARLVNLWGKTLGNPLLRPGAQVEIQGVAAPVAGKYILASVTHVLNSNSGYIAEISSVPPELPQRPRNDTATLGIVTHVNDPEKLGRVRAVLPAYNRVETGWMPVVLPGAGQHKGLVTLPNVNDEVLLLLLREDPARAIVLGGIYGQSQPKDSGIGLNGQVQRYIWRTADGQEIELNQSRNLIRLSNGGGSEIEMEGDTISLKGSHIQLLAKDRIDFKRTLIEP